MAGKISLILWIPLHLMLFTFSSLASLSLVFCLGAYSDTPGNTDNVLFELGTSFSSIKPVIICSFVLGWMNPREYEESTHHTAYILLAIFKAVFKQQFDHNA